MDWSSGLHDGLQRLGYQFVPFLMAVVGHEFGHGLMAYFWGDHTAKDSGRLTLKPIPHIDPIGTLLFPMINMVSGITVMFGWARPVPIDPRRFRNFRLGLFWTALAGPGMNLVMAFLNAIGLCLMVKFAPPDFIFFKEFTAMMEIGVFINYGLGIFNLLPIPPLDGSKVIESFLSYRAMQQYEKVARYSAVILILLIFTGAISFIQKPIMLMGNITINIVAYLMNVPITG